MIYFPLNLTTPITASTSAGSVIKNISVFNWHGHILLNLALCSQIRIWIFGQLANYLLISRYNINYIKYTSKKDNYIQYKDGRCMYMCSDLSPVYAYVKLLLLISGRNFAVPLVVVCWLDVIFFRSEFVVFRRRLNHETQSKVGVECTCFCTVCGLELYITEFFRLSW
jgi:hypothetical protein